MLQFMRSHRVGLSSSSSRILATSLPDASTPASTSPSQLLFLGSPVGWCLGGAGYHMSSSGPCPPPEPGEACPLLPGHGFLLVSTMKRGAGGYILSCGQDEEVGLVG